MEKVLIDGSTSHVTHELSDEVFKRTKSVGWDRRLYECGVRGYKWLTEPIDRAFVVAKRPWFAGRNFSWNCVTLTIQKQPSSVVSTSSPAGFKDCQIEDKVDSIESGPKSKVMR